MMLNIHIKNRTINKYLISLAIILLLLGDLTNITILLDINSNFN